MSKRRHSHALTLLGLVYLGLAALALVRPRRRAAGGRRPAPTQPDAPIAAVSPDGTDLTRRRPLPAADIALVLIWSIGVPGFVYLSLAVVSMPTLSAMLFGVATCYVVMAMALAVEGALALPRRRAVDRDGRPLEPVPVRRPVSALVLAYLPNEEEIIVDTVRHLLTGLALPPEQLQVVLAYNTPERLPVEAELERLARWDPRLVLVRVPDSKTKAENVNAALPFLTGEVTAMFDSDHRPEPHCFEKALRWVDAGYDVVQGRCAIRNGSTNWLTRLINIEFGSMYVVAHAARSLAVDTALFGGSNGYWRTEVLRSLRMERSMLTEDIDLTVRALLGGARVVHDRSLIATELAPAKLSSWFFQRLRWAQGWYQVTRKHTRLVAKSSALNAWQRLYWMYLLPWREFFAVVAPQAMLMLIAIAAVHVSFGVGWQWNAYLTGTTVITLLGGTLTTLSGVRHAWGEARPRKRDVLAYLLVSPLAVQVKNTITLVAWVREWRTEREWITTPRTVPAAPCPSPGEAATVRPAEAHA